MLIWAVGAPGRQVPMAQKSPLVQALPSSQAFALFAKTQPVDLSQLSVVHTLLSLHTRGPPGWHVPSVQKSPTVQALPSEQAFALFVKTQPLAVSQLSVVHGLLSLQFIAVPGRHVPKAQKSPAVHALPSSQAFALFVKTQPVVGLQLSVVHTLLSSQTRGVPTHAPAEQVSPVVHPLRSLHAFVLYVKTHPAAGSQLSVVHTLLSPHTRGTPGWHVPPVQTSLTVQALPSEHAFALFV